MADTVRHMKIKSHKSKWALALCAVALFSFTVAQAAQTRLIPASILDQGKTPAGVTDPNTAVPRNERPPALTPRDEGPVQSGSFTGTVME